MAIVKIENLHTNNNIKAFQVENRTDADVFIFVTDLRGVGQGKEYIWTYTENEGEADLRIFWGKTKSDSLKVCFVDDIAIAGWKNTNHGLHKNLL